MGAHRKPFTRFHITGDAERVSLLISTNDPFGSGFASDYTSRREVRYYRIGRITAMDRALSRVDLVPTSHTLSVQVEYADVTEYC